MTEGDTGNEDRPDAAPGWYPDPKGISKLRYWNGSIWTDHVWSSKPPRGPLDGARMLVVAGGIALAVSPLLPWVDVVLLGNLNLFQLLNLDGRSKALAWLVLLAGVAAGGVAFRARQVGTVRVAALAIALIGGLVVSVKLSTLHREVSNAHEFAAVGIGPYVALAGCLAMVVGALFAKSTQPAG